MLQFKYDNASETSVFPLELKWDCKNYSKSEDGDSRSTEKRGNRRTAQVQKDPIPLLSSQLPRTASFSYQGHSTSGPQTSTSRESSPPYSTPYPQGRRSHQASCWPAWSLHSQMAPAAPSPVPRAPTARPPPPVCPCFNPRRDLPISFPSILSTREQSQDSST